MPTFEWKGSRAGQMQSGVLNADSKEAANEILRRQRIEAPSIKEKGKEIAFPKFGGGVAPQLVAIFTRQFSVMIDAGLPLVQCLDILGSQVVAEFIAHLRDEGKAVILTTHRLDEAERLCDRFGLLHRGRLVSEGHAIDLLGVRATLKRLSGTEPGATGSPMIHVYGSENVELDHLTVFGGFPGLLVNASKNVRVTHSAFRGQAAPWTARSGSSTRTRGSARRRC